MATRSTRIARALALAVAVASAAYAADRLPDFAHRIEIVPAGAEGLQALALPAAVYSGAVRADLADLRVFNAAGEAVPFAFAPEPVPERIERPRVPLAVFPVRADPARNLDGLSLTIDRGAAGTRIRVDEAPDGATAEQPVVAYLADASAVELPIGALLLSGVPIGTVVTVKVDASDDLRSWRSVAHDAAIVHLASEGAVLERLRVDFGATRAKYFRIAWRGARSFALAGVSADTGSETAAGAPREWTERAGRAGERPGEFLFDAGAQYPVDRLRFTLPEPNTIGRVEILARANPEAPWRPVVGTVLYALTRDGAQVTSPDVDVPRTTDRYWMVRADARGGGIGRTPPAIAFGWRAQKIVFAARGTPPFTLAFGSHQAAAGAIAIQTIVPGYKPERLASLALARVAGSGDRSSGRSTADAAPTAIEPPPVPLDTKRWILWASLLAGVAVVAGLAWRVLRAGPPAGGGAGDPT